MKRRIVTISVFTVVALALTTIGPSIWGASVGSGWRLIAIGGSDAPLADGRPTAQVATTPSSFAAITSGVDGGRDLTQPDFDRYLVAVVHVGDSGSCPPQLGGVDVTTGRITVRVTRGPAVSCTDDLHRYAIVLRLERAAVGDGASLAVRVETRDRGSFDLVAPIGS